MSFSTFYGKPIVLNDNYKFLKHEHILLQNYFKELFVLLDDDIDPSTILMRLFDKYFNCKMEKLYPGRIINQKKLVQEIKRKITTMPPSVTEVFELLNKLVHHVDPNDDFVYLLSAYCSLFPVMYALIKNKSLKDALIIRDINNQYYHTILKKSLAYSAVHNLLIINNKTIEIAWITNQYEWLVRYFVGKMNIDSLSQFSNMEVLIKYATKEQVETIVLPVVMGLLEEKNKDSSQLKEPSGRKILDNHVYIIVHTILPCIIKKVGDEALETVIMPKLLELFKLEDIPSTKEIFLTCMDRMDAEALKRCLKPFLLSYLEDKTFFCHEDNIYHEWRMRLILELYVTMISKSNIQDNKELFPNIILKIQSISITWLDSFMNLLKELQNKQLHVNDMLFQTVFKKIESANNNAIENLSIGKTAASMHISHLTKEQVENIFYKISFEEQEKKIDKAFVAMLAKFSDLCVDVYPASLQEKSLKFIYQVCISHKENITYLPALIRCLKKCELKHEASRKILVELSHYANENIRTNSRINEARELYCQLLETCAALMTEQEIKQYIVPMIDVSYLKNIKYTQAMHGTMYHIFNRVNDNKIAARFISNVIFAFIKSSFLECDDLLQPLINKVDPFHLVYICRQLLRTEVSNLVLERTAYVLALIYKRNRELFADVPGICSDEQRSVRKGEVKFSKIRSALTLK